MSKAINKEAQMRATVNQIELTNAVNAARAAVKSRTIQPVLACVRLTCDDNQITVEGTDLEVMVRVRSHQVQIERAGAVCVNAERLATAVGPITSDAVHIEVDGAQLVVSGGHSRFTLPTIEADKFPPTASIKADRYGDIPAADFRRMVSQTAHATQQTDTVGVLCGVLVCFTGTEAVMVGADTRHMAVSRSASKSKKHSGWVVLPRVLSIVSKAIDDDGVVSVSASENLVVFDSGETMVRATTLEGSFPPWQDVIPKLDEVRVSGETKAFLDAVQQVSSFADEVDPGMKLTLSADGASMASRSKGGAATAMVACRVDGGPLCIGLNARLVRDGIRAVDKNELTIKFGSARTAMLVEAGSFQYVQMPMAIKE